MDIDIKIIFLDAIFKAIKDNWHIVIIIISIFIIFLFYIY